jgi:hypothetical protein
MQREHGLSGSPGRFAESPLAAVWKRASDGHALAAGNIACIREARREAEWPYPRLIPGGDDRPSFWARLRTEVMPDLPESGRPTRRERIRLPRIA